MVPVVLELVLVVQTLLVAQLRALFLRPRLPRRMDLQRPLLPGKILGTHLVYAVHYFGDKLKTTSDALK